MALQFIVDELNVYKDFAKKAAAGIFLMKQLASLGLKTSRTAQWRVAMIHCVHCSRIALDTVPICGSEKWP